METHFDLGNRCLVVKSKLSRRLPIPLRHKTRDSPLRTAKGFSTKVSGHLTLLALSLNSVQHLLSINENSKDAYATDIQRFIVEHFHKSCLSTLRSISRSLLLSVQKSNRLGKSRGKLTLNSRFSPQILADTCIRGPTNSDQWAN